MGKEFTEERGNLLPAPQFVCGPPSTSRAHRKRRAKGEGVRGRNGKPSPCPPLCLRAAPLPPGRAINGREAGKEFAKERGIRPSSASTKKMEGKRVGRSQKEGKPSPPNMFCLRASRKIEAERGRRSQQKELAFLIARCEETTLLRAISPTSIAFRGPTSQVGAISGMKSLILMLFRP